MDERKATWLAREIQGGTPGQPFAVMVRWPQTSAMTAERAAGLAAKKLDERDGKDDLNQLSGSRRLIEVELSENNWVRYGVECRIDVQYTAEPLEK